MYTQTLAPRISSITREPVFIGPSDQQVIPEGAVVKCEKIVYGGNSGVFTVESGIKGWDP